MALWPFRRKSARKRSRGATLSDTEVTPLRSQADVAPAGATPKKAKTEPAKLQRRQRAYSFSPGRHDSIRIDREGRQAMAANRGSRHARNAEQTYAPDWQPTPTLHPTRRKSSKRRREDHDREAEIKAMSACMPSRSAMETHGISGGPKQSTKRAKKMSTLAGRQHKPTSQVSLPYPDSVRSAMSAESDSVAYKISMLDALAPRPTLRYSSNPRASTYRASAPVAMEPLKRAREKREPMDEDPVESQKRIDDLADDLDARDLRELMERDNRRRERKRLQDQERMERRLTRRAERQRREEAEAAMSAAPPRPTEHRQTGASERESANVGLGIEPVSTSATSPERPKVAPPSFARAEPSDGTSVPPLDLPPPRVETPKDDETLPDAERAGTADAYPNKIQERAAASSQAPAPEEPTRLAGILRAKKSRSKSTLGSDKDRLAEEEYGRNNSNASNRTGSRMSFASFLKWGTKGKRQSGPSSFSNTSREEMQAGVNAQALAQAEALAKLQGDDPSSLTNHAGNSKSASATPKRTKSRFREDLPDFPISPPDSRMQSPEAEPPLPALPEKSTEVSSRPSRHHTPPAVERPKEAQAKGPHLSMSLASIDSEGSWLSGRVASAKTSAKRDSLRINPPDNTHPSSSSTNSAQECVTATEDERFSLSAPDGSHDNIGAGVLDGQDDHTSQKEETASTNQLRWGRVGAKPEVVEAHFPDRDTMRSRQGLMNIDSGDEEDAEMLTPSSTA